MIDFEEGFALVVLILVRTGAYYNLGKLRSFNSGSEKSEVPIDISPPTPISVPTQIYRRL